MSEMLAGIPNAGLARVRELVRRGGGGGPQSEVRGDLGTHSSMTSPPPNDHPSRHVPAAIRRAVWSRDMGRCA